MFNIAEANKNQPLIAINMVNMYPVEAGTKVRSSRPEVFCKKGVFRNFAKFTGKHLCQSLFFTKVAGLRPVTLLKKETLVQVFSCEFCAIFKSTFFTEGLR